MSLAIDIDNVTDVLLADGWHAVAGGSFFIDIYEYLWFGRGRTRDPIIEAECGQGAGWHEGGKGTYTYCPLTSILAVRVKIPNTHNKRTA